MQLSKIRECRHLLNQAQKETMSTNADATLSKWDPEAIMQAIKDDLLSTEKQLEADHKERLQVQYKETMAATLYHTSLYIKVLFNIM